MTPNIPLDKVGDYITIGTVKFFHTAKDASNFVDWITTQGLVQADPTLFRTQDYLRWNELNRPDGENTLF